MEIKKAASIPAGSTDTLETPEGFELSMESPGRTFRGSTEAEMMGGEELKEQERAIGEKTAKAGRKSADLKFAGFLRVIYQHIERNSPMCAKWDLAYKNTRSFQTGVRNFWETSPARNK